MSGVIKLEKFPEIFWQGRRLVWDTRQSVGIDPELLILPEDLAFELRAELLKRPQAIPANVPDPRDFLAQACAAHFAHPSSRLKVFGVTGTNGKTTTLSLLRAILVAAGWNTAEIGTLGIQLWRGGATAPYLKLETGFTTPEAPTLQKFLFDVIPEGIQCVVMEVSSHAVSLARAAHVDFDGVIFTNLSQDHLDFHGTMQAYEMAKAQLFTHILPGPLGSTKTKWALLNGNDPAGQRIFSQVHSSVHKKLYGENIDFSFTRETLAGLTYHSLDAGQARFTLPMVGRFNAENAHAATELARLCLGIDTTTIQKALREFPGAKGRLEKVSPPHELKNVFVDFAHSPDAIEKTLRALHALKDPKANLWIVFGCGGDRDRAKRPLMGEVAARLAQHVVLTSDNPRTEQPEAILHDICAGIPAGTPATVTVIADRASAIRHALTHMSAGDVCVVAGKGHEEYQIIGTRSSPFSDQEICRDFFAT